MSQTPFALQGMIAIEPSPYTYVRTIVMRSDLLSKQDYDKMLKMELAEIIQFLEESQYKREIDELALAESGITLIEHAVARNFRRTVEKLRRISEPPMRLLIDTYLWRSDIQNIKTVLRARHTGEKREKIANLILPGVTSKEALLTLLDKQTMEDAVAAISVPFPLNAKLAYKNGGLTGLEGELTKAYYLATLTLARHIKRGGEALKEFLLLEVMIMNIITILKLKREGASKERIREYLVVDAKHMDGQYARTLTALLEAPDIPATFAVLRRSQLRKAIPDIEQAFAERANLLEVERGFQLYLLRHTSLLSHTHPLSLDIVLSYLFAKVNETRNIFMLIKGKQLGVAESYLEQELVIA